MVTISDDLALKILKTGLHDLFLDCDAAFSAFLGKAKEVRYIAYKGEVFDKKSKYAKQLSVEEMAAAENAAKEIFNKMMYNEQYTELLEILREDYPNSYLYELAEKMNLFDSLKFQML